MVHGSSRFDGEAPTPIEDYPITLRIGPSPVEERGRVHQPHRSVCALGVGASTMLYARVHDRTVAEDYYAAMAQVENRSAAGEADEPDERTHLLGLLDRLAEPRLEMDERLRLVSQVRRGLNRPGLRMTRRG